MVLLLVTMLLLMLIYFRYFYNTVLVKSGHNAETYRVIDSPTKQTASDLIAQLDTFAKGFILNLREKYSKPGMDPLGYELVKNLTNRYRGGSSLAENSPHGLETSYTLNKGDYIAICLRKKIPPYDLHDIEILKYVFLHELTHVAMTKSDPKHIEFWKYFKFILREAVAQNIYTPVDYQTSSTVYCGTEVKYNPYFDKSIQ